MVRSCSMYKFNDFPALDIGIVPPRLRRTLSSNPFDSMSPPEPRHIRRTEPLLPPNVMFRTSPLFLRFPCAMIGCRVHHDKVTYSRTRPVVLVSSDDQPFYTEVLIFLRQPFPFIGTSLYRIPSHSSTCIVP